jgi:hypothetical protein
MYSDQAYDAALPDSYLSRPPQGPFSNGFAVNSHATFADNININESLAMSLMSFQPQDSAPKTSKMETLVLLYQLTTGGDNLLTSSLLSNIRRVEQAVTSSHGFTSHCLSSSVLSGSCVPPSSVLSFLYPSIDGSNFVFDGKGSTMVPDVDYAIKLLLQQDRYISLPSLSSFHLLIASTMLVD